MGRMSQSPAFFTALSRGLRGRCPHCGEGRLFRSYLKVQSDCAGCGVDLTRYPADDGPAYFTILLVGHLVIVPILFIPYVWQGPPVVTVPLVLTPLTLVTLALLPIVKGAFIGHMAYLRLTSDKAEQHTADQA
ncbi:MAG: DUF983 domain-containing protein [Phenylobacterium sp.]|jgi:uncharacterized protein (DUF983 family)|nr:DUF983 domain-containing protein [Phenylobacterium sp.]MCA3756856.1 DUF983 domain-containing protein [Phenylobacterium sp.]MCA6256450.1 DUF983 domain-containing protein [Phenylobacterium sp.]